MNKKHKHGKYARRAPFAWLLWLLIAALYILIVVGMIRLGNSLRAQKMYQELANTARPVATEPAPTLPAPVQPQETIPATEPPVTEPQMLARYAELYEKNSDLFGWVKIDDTKIDYPVMHAPDELEKYLHTDFNGKYFYGGTPYMDVRCTADSENYILYGHNMIDGSMFKGIMKYENKKFWETHQTVNFDTLYEEGEYEVVAAFYDQVYSSTDTCFKFYNVIELEDAAAYDDAIANFKKKALYDTGVTPEFGTQLVTLVTCAYHTDNGKFVVVLAQKGEN